jgi:hypothetical protein
MTNSSNEGSTVVVFVSGHLRISVVEFLEHYVPHLRYHLDQGHAFVVGDARGADTMAQQWLKEHGAKVTVFHMFAKPRNNVGFPTVCGFKTDEERDVAMTLASHTDVAWVRPGRELVSGTAKNLLRRQSLSSS